VAYAVQDLRDQVRRFARNALDSSVYPDQQIDGCLQLAGDEWVRLTRGSRVLVALTLTSGSNALPAIPADCSPDRVLQVFLLLNGQIIDPEFEFTSYEEIQRDQYLRRGLIDPSVIGTAGQPKKMAFIDRSSGIVWPTPQNAYTIELWYSQPFTSWTAGGTPSPNAFNLSDEYLRVIARYGAPGHLQLNEKANGVIAQGALAEFRSQAKKVRAANAGGRGGQTSTRVDPRDGR
jgi:hypothetical protein